MKRNKIAACICLFMLSVSPMAAGTVPVSAVAISGNTAENGLVYAEGVPYNGYYMESAGIFYTVSGGVPRTVNGLVGKGTRYYQGDGTEKMLPMTLPRKTVFVSGKPYTGYYTNANKKMYLAGNGTQELKTGTLNKGTRYYNSNTGKMLTLPRQTLYVKGQVYTGFYLDGKNKMHTVKKGTQTLKTGVLQKKTRYYSHNSKKTQKLSKETLYVKGKTYFGYYLGSSGKMYHVKKGTRTLKTGVVKKGTGYYNAKSQKMRKLSSETIYLDGKAVKNMSKASFETLLRARKIADCVTNDRMTKPEKLKACFDFVKTYPECNPRTPHYKGMDWPVIYANDMFVRGTGNCCSYGAAFAYMAKAIGYEEVYCCNSGGHGWAEINGLVYDPEWSIHFHVYSYYGLSYDARTDQNYKGAIGAGLPWMHIKI